MKNSNNKSYIVLGLLIYTIIYPVQNCVGTKVIANDPMDLKNDDYIIANTFSDCMIHIINFRGLNVNFAVLKTPIVLLRYVSFQNHFFIYPVELFPNNTSTILQSETTIKSLSINQGVKYVSNISSIYFKLGNKNVHCEVNIYLNPLSTEKLPGLYYKNGILGTILKDPFWTNFRINAKSEDWKRDYLNTVPKYSLLVCNLNEDSICAKPNDRNNWITGVIFATRFIRRQETVLVFQNLITHKELFVLCPYCDPCDQFKLVQISNFEPNRKSMDENIIQIYQTEIQAYTINMLVSLAINQYDDLMKKERQTKRAVLEHINMLKLKQASAIVALADLHLVSHMLSKNTTLIVNDEFDPYDQYHTCTGSKPFRYLAKFQPLISNNVQLSTIQYQEIGLMFRNVQLRFVSCHKEQSHWIHQLQELVIVFDVCTWLFVIMCVLIQAQFLKYLDRKIDNFKKLHIDSLKDTCLCLYACFLDQSSNLFANVQCKRNLGFYIGFASIPLTFLMISNQYKGENIMRITLESPLVWFDNFNTLAEYRFKIYVPRYHLSNGEQDAIGQNLGVEHKYTQENGHEAFPVVSKLWRRVMLSFSYSDWGRLVNMKSKLSKDLWLYFNHSKMFPAETENMSSIEYGRTSSVAIEKHMENCEKSAVIVSNEEAILLYNNLRVKKKPAYFGKNIIQETLMGYKFRGYFPPNIFQRCKSYFQAGIVEWWQKYFRWSLMIKSRVEEMKIMSRNDENGTLWDESKGKGGIYALSCIPVFGLTLAVITFLVLDSKIPVGLWRFLKRVTKATTKVKLFKKT